jgi:exo-beta-1,3-glucanase (GH17 family)
MTVSRREALFALFQHFIPLVVLGSSLVAVLAWWWGQGQPQAIFSSHAVNQSVPLRCISYAPFRRPNASPFTPNFKVSKRDIEEDLQILKQVSSCVRIYGISGGLDQVPQVARELGMKVRLGAWLGKDKKENQRELGIATELTKSHSDVIELLIVGNEVLLRKDLLPIELIALLDQAKVQSAVPITYADVWEFWRSAPELASHVDSISVHILPYWEDEPVAAPQAIEHVFSTFAQMQQVFPNKRLWIGETGWPAAGRQRRGAVPDPATQIRFVREVAARGEREKIDVNIIEAFDQPWKRALEGAMGGAWGLFDADGHARSQNRSTYVTDPQWWRGWLASLIGAIVGLSIAFALKNKPRDKAMLSLYFAFAGSLLPAQIDFIMLWARTTQEIILAACNAVIVIAGSIALLQILMLLMAGENNQQRLRQKQFSFVWAAMLFTTATSAIVLLADPRYRGFPLALYALPAVVSIAVLFQFKLTTAYRRGAKFLSAILTIAAIGMLGQEHLDNSQAVTLCAYWLCIASPALLSTWLSRSPAPIATSPANKNAKAQSSGV